MSNRIVIVGAGQAAGQALDTLIRREVAGPITLIGEEAHPPYQRPPLSKKVLTGDMTPERTFLRGADHFADKGVTLHLSRRAVSLDRDGAAVEMDDGTRMPYDHLLLATGGRARHLPVPGAGLPGVHVLRTLDDAQAIRDAFRPGARLVVVGGGFIGLEVAASARDCGLEVTVLEAAPALLGRVMPPVMSGWFLELHRSRGVRVHLGATVQAFQGDDRVQGVVTGNGEEVVPADIVVVGIGIVPNQELAENSGLPCDDGILVDERCATSDPQVFAAGDCTRHPSSLVDGPLRLESVPNAMGQGRVAASNIAGDDARYDEMPWFWSDQYGVKLQMVGLSQGHDRAVLRGAMSEDGFGVFYFRGDTLIAADLVNNPRDFMLCRKKVPLMPRLDPDQLADASQPLQEILA